MFSRAVLAGILMASTFLVPASDAQAIDWFWFVHCTGAEHEGGEDPPQETEGSTQQCHGQYGDDGTCGNSDPQLDVVWSVSCGYAQGRWGGPPLQSCQASVICPDLEQIECGGRNTTEAFGGVMVINGVVRGFVHCPDGNNPGSDYCD